MLHREYKNLSVTRTTMTLLTISIAGIANGQNASPEKYEHGVIKQGSWQSGLQSPRFIAIDDSANVFDGPHSAVYAAGAARTSGESSDPMKVNIVANPAGYPYFLNTITPSDPYWDVSPDIATDGDGLWISIWSSRDDMGGSGHDEDIVMSTSSDDGRTWSDQLLINNDAMTDIHADHEARIAYGVNGVWVVTYLAIHQFGLVTDIMMACQSVDNGLTWSDPIRLNTNADDQRVFHSSPEIASDGNGNWVLVWDTSLWANNENRSETDIAYATSSDNGATWSSPAPVNPWAEADLGITDIRPHVATDKAGTWMVTWGSNYDLDSMEGLDFDILRVVSTDNGASWSEPALISPPDEARIVQEFTPVVASDGKGLWVAAWSSNESLGGIAGNDRDIFATTSTDDGMTWSEIVILSNINDDFREDDYEPSITTDSSGNWAITWWNIRESYVTYSTDDATTWSPPFPIDSNELTGSGTEVYPRIEAGGLGYWIMVWQSDVRQGGSHDGDILYSRIHIADGEGEVDGPFSCTTNSILGQPGGQNPGAYVPGSDQDTHFAAESFSGATDPITKVRWWGIELLWETDAACARTSDLFEVSFYDDIAGQPGSIVCSYVQYATKDYLGGSVNTGGATIDTYFRYDMTLEKPCFIDSGWVSIRSIDTDSCEFFWVVGEHGDGSSQIYDSVESTWSPLSADLAICLTTGNPADIDRDGKVDAMDIQLIIMAVLGIGNHLDIDVNGDGILTAVDVQLVINAALTTKK